MRALSASIAALLLSACAAGPVVVDVREGYESEVVLEVGQQLRIERETLEEAGYGPDAGRGFHWWQETLAPDGGLTEPEAVVSMLETPEPDEVRWLYEATGPGAVHIHVYVRQTGSGMRLAERIVQVEVLDPSA